MAGYTLVQAQSQLDAWMAASAAIAGNQSYEIGDRKLTRADASEAQGMIKFWRDEVNRLTASASRRRGVRYAVLG